MRTRRELRTPALGDGVDEGRIAAWQVAPGARVAAGQVLCEIETDKTTVTVEAPEASRIVELVAPVNALVAVGALIAYYDAGTSTEDAGAYRAPGSVRPEPSERGGPRWSRVHSGAEWEGRFGYCRAVRAGPLVVVSGTAPVAPSGGTWAPGDAYAQTQRCLEIIDAALRELGVGRASVIRTRMFVTDITRSEEFGRAHGEFFAGHPPATSMVEVRRLIAPDMLVEIEADAWLWG
jgi:pyruvate/2-oxoglutarate dehydrogenase complex dihydrolipoamide acyltransferase (E2) component